MIIGLVLKNIRQPISTSKNNKLPYSLKAPIAKSRRSTSTTKKEKEKKETELDAGVQIKEDQKHTKG